VQVHRNARLTVVQRLELVEFVLVAGHTRRAAALEFRVSERTVYKWLARFRERGAAGLVDRSSRPRRSPRRTPSSVAAAIEMLRFRRLSGPAIARVLRMARSTVSVVLRRLGLNRLSRLDPPEPPNRYERRQPGDLVHIDIKKLGRFVAPGVRVTGDRSGRSRRAGWEYLHVCIDDHSRLAYVELRDTQDRHDAVEFFEHAVAFYADHGVAVRRVMTDNGGCYRSHEWRTRCTRLGIRHLTTRPYRPRTNGKAERLIQTLLRDWAYIRPYNSSNERAAALAPWIHFYNHRRPHGSLNDKAPITRIPAEP
jgi:transposase InsO family protein